MEFVKSNSGGQIKCNWSKQKTTLPLSLDQSRNRAVKITLPKTLKSVKSNENAEPKRRFQTALAKSHALKRKIGTMHTTLRSAAMALIHQILSD